MLYQRYDNTTELNYVRFIIRVPKLSFLFLLLSHSSSSLTDRRVTLTLECSFLSTLVDICVLDRPSLAEPRD